MDPNPNYHHVSFVKKMQAIAAECLWPFVALAVCIRRKGRGRITLKEELYWARFRFGFKMYPLSIFRVAFAGDAVAKRVLNSPRFDAVKSNLYEHVRKPDFAGYWMFRHSFTDPKPPSSSDLVICYVHGGGYAVWQPGTYTAFILAIVEAIMKRGLTVSVFALDYSLAPEAGFPTQVGQMAAMYKYLHEEMDVDYDKIAFVGDSAGGHLCLSFLTHLHRPTQWLSPNPSEGLPKPGQGVFLMSPFVTADTSCSTYQTNDGLDMLSKSIVTQYSGIFLDASEYGNTDLALPYVQFVVYPVPGGRDWAQILPKKVWVSAGTNEVSEGHIEQLADAMREASIDVRFSLTDGKSHDWQFVDCLKAEKAYLGVPLGHD
ncbi:alpha/beta-hydrolase, partial [Punctularia strigosozonata HHB-11173 SS5]|uniref:alpha/beta-hydrolase n=1 Tax=Punctularia strigosozonata (strain HHB-11173) TaxID=741275 RepID=UPI0004417758